MANSERANRNFNSLIRSKEQQIKNIKALSTAIDFISDMEASKLIGVEYGIFRKMVEDSKVIAYENELLTFIPTFQFNEDNEVSPLFKEFLNQISNDVKGKKYHRRNLVLNTLLGYFGFYHPNEFGGESSTEIRGFEYINRFGKEGVTRVAESFQRTINHEMGM